MSDKMTRAARQRQVTAILDRAYPVGKWSGLVSREKLVKEIDNFYHPRKLREEPTVLGVVTYDPARPDFPWLLAEETFNGVVQSRFDQLASVYLRICSNGMDTLTHLTDDELERCLPLRKQPWEE